MTPTKQLWVLTGGNGAGKTTFYKTQLKPLGIQFVNADIIAETIDSDNPENVSYDAAILAENVRRDLLQQGVSFCFETVFSHPSKIDFLSEAIACGYSIVLVYIHLCDSSLNEARVHQRVTDGGHSVPVEKIHSRIPRTMKHIKTALTIVQEAWILDNSSYEDRFKPIMIVKSGNYDFKVDPIPDWVKELISIKI